jgi:hypothetical protein
MDNYERISRVFFDIEAVGMEVGSGRITNRMLKKVERNIVILKSVEKDDDEFKPVVSKIYKIIDLFRAFAKAYNSGNAVEGQKLSEEMITLILECKSFADKKRGDLDV